MKLTVATYNILHGRMAQYDSARLTESIRACGADLVGIQEVDVGATRSGGRDVAALLADALGYHVRFAKAIDLQGGAYGTAILSRFPIASFEVIPLESGKYEHRSLGMAQITVADRTVRFLNTHLSYENKEQRTLQLQQIKPLFSGKEPALLTGDFNTADFDELRVLGDVTLANDFAHRYGTFRETDSGIDNIIATKPWRIGKTGMIANEYSDHNLLFAELELE